MAKMAWIAEVLKGYPSDVEWVYMNGRVTVYKNGEIVDIISEEE